MLEADPWVVVFGLRGGEVDLGMVDRGEPGERRFLRQREGQAAGAAADFEHLLAIRDAGMVDEQRRQMPAPASHQLFVIARVAGIEHRRHGRLLGCDP